MRTLVPAFLLSACVATPPVMVSADLEPDGSSAPATPFVPSCSAHGNVELIPLDIWGRDLPSATVTLDVPAGALALPDSPPASRGIRLGSTPVSWMARVEAPDHLPTAVTVSWDGSGSREGYAVTAPEGTALLATGFELVSDARCPVLRVYVGLDHAWYAATARAPSLNQVELLIDGEEHWASIYEAVSGARERVTWSTWWWDSEFQLLRDDVWTPPETRWDLTALGLLESLEGVERRLLLNKFLGSADDVAGMLNLDAPLRAHAEQPGGIEVIHQGNDTAVPVAGQVEVRTPTVDFAGRVSANPRFAGRALDKDRQLPPPPDISLPLASYHQKAIVVDGDIAFVTGFNSMEGDWDTPEHDVFDPRRSHFYASQSEWDAVADGEQLPAPIPGTGRDGLRKDYGLRVEGPLARDVEAVLHQRWEHGIDRDDPYADRATSFALDPVEIGEQAGVSAQVVVTMPEPFPEQSILETHLKSIRNATELILIEDQYLRAPILNGAILDRMHQVPDLRLLVVTFPPDAWTPGAQHTWVTHATFQQEFPHRYLAMELKAADLQIDEGWLWDDVSAQFPPIFNHSKLRIVDDVYLSVGSCNYNNRGYLFEAEMNVSVFDRPFVTDARRRVFERYLGPDLAAQLTGEVTADFELLRDTAMGNAAVEAWWSEHAGDLDASEARATWRTFRPTGFIYPAGIIDDYAFTTGPDAA